MNIPNSPDGPGSTVQVDLRAGVPDPRLELFAPSPGESGPEEFDWRRIWSAVKRRRWIILAVVGVGTAAGALATRFSPPRYRAEATVWIDSRDPREGGPAPIQPGRLLDPEAWLDLARSYAVLDQAVRAGRLYLTVPRHTPPALFAAFAVADTFRPGRYTLKLDQDGATLRLLTADGLELDRAKPGDSLGARLGIRWTPPPGVLAAGGSAKFELHSLRDASTRLADQLQLHIDEQGNLLRFDMEGSDPDRIARTLEMVADRFVAVAADLKRQKLSELTAKLDDQLTSASDALVRAESTYEVFRTRTITLPSEHTTAAPPATPAGGGDVADPLTDHYFSLQAARDALRRDREALDRALRSGPGGGVSIEALNAIPAVKGSRELGPALDTLVAEETELRGLQTKYSDQHPLVIQTAERVNTLRDRTIPGLARALLAELQHREGLASQDASAASASLRSIPARSLEEARLRRTVALAEDLHNTLQQRHEEAQLAEASAVADTRILDHAEVPRTPVRDTAARLLLLAFVGSLGLALVGVVLLDRADPKFNYPSQITRELRLPILGAIPHLGTPARGGEAARLPAGSDGVAPLIESLRGIRMALLTEAREGHPILFTISSPGSGDGKSFIASHLAHSFAEAGFATVLVDGDVRRGHLHRRFGASRRPGLCDLLQGTGTLEAALCATDYPDLTLLPCGARARRAPELLAGPGMGRVMESLRRRFQVVVVDSPPLSAGIDPYVLSVATGRLLLVMRSGVSHREMMAAKLSVLGRMPIDLMGVVMNDVPHDPSYGYYSYYLEGYDARDEERAVPAGGT